MKTTIKRIVASCVLVAAVGAFFGLPTAWVCKVQPAFSWTFLVVLLLAPIVGRLFCEVLCPLGILQSVVNRLFHYRKGVRRVCTRLPQTKVQVLVRLAVLAAFAALVACGFGGAAWMLAPYSIFGKAMTLFLPGVAVFAVVMALAAVGRGRVWCNWICPAGTLFSLLSWRSICCHKVGAGCANCRACFPKKPDSSASAPQSGQDGQDGQAGSMTRREVLHGMAVVAAVAAAEKTTDGGYAPVSLPSVAKRPSEVLPPGARNRADFARLCVGCGLCVANCPGSCLVPSVSLRTFGQPLMSFQRGSCLLACPQKCADVCPAGAIVKLADVARRDIHMGHAIWRKDLCLRQTDGVPCTACSRKCPVKAIRLVEGFPVVDKAACIGCGLCEHVCPVRPEPAIIVKGFDVQRVVRPFSMDDLLSEMVALVKGGASIVSARDGVIVAKGEGKGVLPAFELLGERKLAHCVVVDKVVGRAAAAAFVVGKASKVHALVMSEDAMSLLRSHGVEASAETTVPKILDAQRDGRCPMELAVEGLDDPKEIVAVICEKIGLPVPSGDAGRGKVK